MTGSWGSFDRRSTEVPREPLEEDQRTRLDLPRTLRPVPGDGVVQRPVFDPALKQYSNAYRAADPRFADQAVEARWVAARRLAMDLVLTAIAGSEWVDHLVLRGSVLLRTWFGEAAREPGDLDFVVAPQSWRIEEGRTTVMLDGLARAAQRAGEREGGTVRFDASAAVGEDIWTYERVPGRRLVLPWTAEGLPGGVVQLDFVFNERLPVEPEPVLLPRLSGGPGEALLNGVTAELSLAWKLMWLVCDMHPQGKDLHDAVLLAEHCELRYDVLRDTFLDGDPEEALRPVRPETVTALAAQVEWTHFETEYPHLAGSAADQVARLAAALTPTFRAVADADGRGLGSWWLEPWVARYRDLLARKSMRSVQKRMSAAHIPTAAAVAITRELSGPDRRTPAEAYALVAQDPARARAVEHYRRNPGALASDLDSWA
ncbi:nucleotidyl transferase AbiEii/AbiGii toxin family protein [Kitasatospora sp. NBC_00240]|uniref:nucleotidyl transferase AbiEii/AbiGii toxin family protein n=1 Tax=Kitasatospora sp. NBC_00240 TaxID=2903567 RepID=UPI00224D5C2D|nr:nucleotidyl transferase AbiEii/AbiGii toxin family protein [Kitasatospora sp. NBC_00240]MCX5211498.1 nucleotidyl transferase AbiEii/AbiGii toxin family protein [Kitasatospora sp. NBC_00240]